MSANAFSPQSKTYLLTVGATSTASPVKISDNTGSNSSGVWRVSNNSTDDVQLAWGGAAVAAILPIDGTPAAGVYLKAGITETFSIPSGQYAAVIGKVAAGSVTIVTGEGV